jgi:hypothetical protein
MGMKKRNFLHAHSFLDSCSWSAILPAALVNSIGMVTHNEGFTHFGKRILHIKKGKIMPK